MPRSMTSGREQTVPAKNALQRSHKTDNGQIRVESGDKHSWRNAVMGTTTSK